MSEIVKLVDRASDSILLHVTVSVEFATRTACTARHFQTGAIIPNHSHIEFVRICTHGRVVTRVSEACWMGCLIRRVVAGIESRA
jgi:hypothetical protein